MSDGSANIFFQINSSIGVIVLIMNVCLNCWIIFLIFSHRILRTISNILIVNLSFAAVCYSILALIACVYNLRQDWVYEQNGCIVRAFLLVLSLSAICYSYLIQVLSRLFFSIYYQHRFLLHWRMHCLMIIIVWIFSFLISLVPLQTKDGLIFESESRICCVSSKILPIASFCLIVIYVIPLIVVFLVYILILLRVRRTRRRIHASVIQQAGIFNAKRELSLIRRLVLQFISFSSGGILYLFNILWQLLTPIPLPRSRFLLALNLITLSLFASSIFQMSISKTLRQKTRRYFQWLKCR